MLSLRTKGVGKGEPLQSDNLFCMLQNGDLSRRTDRGTESSDLSCETSSSVIKSSSHLKHSDLLNPDTDVPPIASALMDMSPDSLADSELLSYETFRSSAGI